VVWGKLSEWVRGQGKASAPTDS